MASSLLPINQSEFHTKSYWEDFFRKRGTNSFDWYGKFDDFSFLLFEQVKTHETFLVIGCGNSEFSSKLYDSQHKNISNLDFSPIVIAEMVSKNKNRPDMKWLIGDMTNMRDIFQNNLFQNVFDKGALDALVSDNSALCHEKGKQMFEEIERLLAINGKYICITLAQDFVIQSLLDYFASNISSSSILWKISISIIPSKTPSPFSPFFIVISKLPRHIDSISNSPVIAVSFDTMGKSIKQPIEVSPEECIKLVR